MVCEQKFASVFLQFHFDFYCFFFDILDPIFP